MSRDRPPCLREQVAKAINSANLAPSDIRETDVDRVGALAFADPLGVALLALKVAGDAKAHERALALLTHRSKRVCGDYKMRRKLCEVVIEEWHNDRCFSCKGRGFLIATSNSPVRTCQSCLGSGMKKISELWRANQLGMDISVYRKWAPRYARVQRKLVDAEASVPHDVAKVLWGKIPDGFFTPSAIAKRAADYRAAMGRL